MQGRCALKYIARIQVFFALLGPVHVGCLYRFMPGVLLALSMPLRCATEVAFSNV